MAFSPLSWGCRALFGPDLSSKKVETVKMIGMCCRNRQYPYPLIRAEIVAASGIRSSQVFLYRNDSLLRY